MRPAAALTVAPMSHPMPPAKYVLETYDGHVVMHLTPLPEGPVFGSVTHQVRTTAQDTRARVAAGHGYNDCVPIAQHLTVDTSTGDPAAVVHGWTGDWALTNALSRTGRQLGLDNDLPGAIGVATIALCPEGVILARRSMNVAVSPGLLSTTTTEGVTLDDLEVRPDGTWGLDVVQVAQRGLVEELGLVVPEHRVTPTAAVDYGYGSGIGFGVVADLGCTYAEVLAAQAAAPDAWEGSLLLATPDEALELATGQDVGIVLPPMLNAALKHRTPALPTTDREARGRGRMRGQGRSSQPASCRSRGLANTS